MKEKLGAVRKSLFAYDNNILTQIIRKVLQENGTAVDAAIAAMVCNGAVHSHSNGLGGGFFMTIFIKSKNKTFFLNARETAPSYATETMFVNTTADSRRGNFRSINNIGICKLRK